MEAPRLAFWMALSWAVPDVDEAQQTSTSSPHTSTSSIMVAVDQLFRRLTAARAKVPGLGWPLLAVSPALPTVGTGIC